MQKTSMIEIKNAIKSGFADASKVVNKNTADIVGQELSQAVDDAKKMTGVLFSPLVAALKKDDVPKADVKRNSFLEEMVGYFGKQEKAASREFKPDEKKSPWYKLLIGVGLIMGAVAGVILLPFTLLWKGLMAIKPIALFFGKIGKAIKGTLMFKYFEDITKWFKKLPIIGRFLSAFKTGFKFLAWPLQVILMAIDFIKGFVGKEGDIISKIKSGLMNVIKQFIELPVKLFGWIADWFLGLANITVKGGSAKVIMSNVMQFAGIFIDGMVGLFTGIGQAMQGLYNLISPVLMPLIKDIIEGIKILIDGFSAAWETFKPWMLSKILWVGSMFSETIKPALIDLWDLVTSPVRMIQGTVDWMKDFLKNDTSFINQIKKIFTEIRQSIIDYAFSLLPVWAQKLLGIDKKEEPSRQVDSITQDRIREASKYGMAKERKDKKRLEEQKNMTKGLAAQNTMTMRTAASINNNNRVEYATEAIPDESDNALSGVTLLLN